MFVLPYPEFYFEVILVSLNSVVFKNLKINHQNYVDSILVSSKTPTT